MEPAPIQEADVIYLPKEKAALSFVKTQGDITSPSHAPSPLSLLFPAERSLPLQMSLFHSQSSLTLFVCWIPPPSERGPLGGPTTRGEWCAQLAGRPLFTQLAESSTLPSATQTEAEFSPWTMLSMLNTVNRLAGRGNCGHFFLSRVGFSLMVCIKARQCGLISHLQKMDPLRKPDCRSIFSKQIEDLCG